MKPQDFTRWTQDKEIKKIKRFKSCVNLVLISWLNGFNTIPLRSLRPLRFNILDLIREIRTIREISVISFLCVSAPLWLNTAESAEVTRARPIMGTIVQINAIDDNKTDEEMNRILDNAFKAIEDIDRLMSDYKPDSEVSRFNNLKDNENISLSPDTFEVIKRSLEFAKLTDGAFDITVGALSQSARGTVSYSEKDVLRFVGYDKIFIDENTHTAGKKDAGVKIDLGGIAKGYAVDKAVDALKDAGIDNALVDAGGDMYALGAGPNGDGWRIGIQHPRKEDEVIAILKIKDKAVTTSGDYARFPNIFNPQTGAPVEDTPSSVTVIADDATTADALATALFVLGPKDGIALAGSLESIETMVISQQNQDNLTIETSINFDNFIYKKEQNLCAGLNI